MSEWPIQEAQRLLKHLNSINFDSKTQTCIFEMGYAPSGDVHLGTLMEAIRCNMVLKAFEYITNQQYKTKLICFSDDMDGLRKKIDLFIPNSEKYLGTPVSDIPDGIHASFADKMNAKLISFLNHYNVNFEFCSARKFYQSGQFNNGIRLVMKHYDKIMQAMLPTLGEDRQATYSPILPICPKTKKVLLVPIKVNLHDETITYTNSFNEVVTQSPYNGNAKLQWKVDFAMRWKELPVHFEMYGKDHNDSAILYNKICRILGGTPPSQFVYEMFLNVDGSKLSKSKGNHSITIDEWLYYAPMESLLLLMYATPQRAKILHQSIIPKYVDEYITLNEKYHTLTSDEERIQSPIWHLHHDNPIPVINAPMSFNMLINLACVVNTESEDVLLNFVNKHLPNTNHSPFFLSLLKHAIRYANKMIEKSFKIPTEIEREMLQELANDLSDTSRESQKILYDLARKFNYSDTKLFFETLYQILLGKDSGPRMGTFIDIYGRENIQNLIYSKILS